MPPCHLATRRLTVQTALTVQPQRLTVHNREFLTAPVVMLVEGVLNEGLVPASSLVPDDWNGVALVVNHPTDSQGQPVSARSPDVLASAGVGYVYRSRLGTGQRQGQQVASLAGELWLDVAQATALGGEALQAMQMLETQQPLEVSTAFYSDADLTRGSFLGTPYSEVHYNLRPDHLALLPNTLGACNWQQGCGAPRLNCAQEDCACHLEDGSMDDLSPSRWQAFVAMLRQFVTTEDAPRVQVLSAARRPTFSGTESTTWTAPTFATYVAALGSGETRPATVGDAPAVLKRQIAGHTLLGDPAADTFGDLSFFPVVNPRTGKLNENALRAVLGGRGSQANIPAAARQSAQTMARRLLNSEFDANLETNQTDTDLREALYGALAREMGVDVTPIFLDGVDTANQTFTYRQGERLIQRSWAMQDGVLVLSPNQHDVQRTTSYTPVTQQEKELSMPPVTAMQARIDALIANAASGWHETDRPMLERLDEATLIRLEQQPRQVSTEPPKAQTFEELMANAAPDVRESYGEALENITERKAAAIKILMANPNCDFTEEELRAMTAKRLEKMVAMTGHQNPLLAPASYAGRGFPVVNEDDEPPPPPNTLAKVVELQKARGLLH